MEAMKRQFKHDFEMIHQQKHPQIDVIIEGTVKKQRRIRYVRNTLASITVFFLAFTVFLNYHDDFYIYAKSNPYLKEIAKTLRIRDIFEDSESKEIGKDTLSLKEPFEGEIVTHEMKEILVDEKDHYFSYHHSNRNRHYFLKFIETEGIYDPIESIWKYENGRLDKIFNLSDTHYDRASESLQGMTTIDNKLYLVFAEDDIQYLYEYDLDKNKGEFNRNFIFMNVYYDSNLLQFKGVESWYIPLIETEEGYTYQLCSLKEQVCHKLKTYQSELDPHKIPIIRLIDQHHHYFLIEKIQTDRLNWQENTKELEVDYSFELINKKGETLEVFSDVSKAMLKENMVIYQKEKNDQLIYGSYDLLQKEFFETEDVTDFYYHLREKGVVVFALTGEEAWFKNIKSSSPSLRTNLAQFETTKDQLEAKYFIFPDTNPYYIILDDMSGNRIEIHEITFQ